MKKLFRILIKIVILAVICVGVKAGYDTVKSMIYPLKYEDYITNYARENSLDKYLVMGIIRAESNYIHDAHSGKARGLMQITDETAVWIADKMNLRFTAEDIEDPETNIKMGCYYLKYLIDKYDHNVDVALAAYNGGMGNVAKWLSDENCSKDGKSLSYIPFKETREYVEKVNRYTDVYKNMY